MSRQATRIRVLKNRLSSISAYAEGAIKTDDGSKDEETKILIPWSGELDSGPVLVWSQPASGEGGVSPGIWLSSGAIKERMLWREALVTA